MSSLAVDAAYPARGVGSNDIQPSSGTQISTQLCAFLFSTTTVVSLIGSPGVNPSTTREGMPSVLAISAIDVANCSQYPVLTNGFEVSVSQSSTDVVVYSDGTSMA